MNRDPEANGLLETCEELGIGFVPWGPIGMGYLTQKLDPETTSILSRIYVFWIRPLPAVDHRREQAVCRSHRGACEKERLYDRTAIPRMAACPKTFHRSHPWNEQGQAPPREHRDVLQT
jgi:hypothetical protein